MGSTAGKTGAALPPDGAGGGEVGHGAGTKEEQERVGGWAMTGVRQIHESEGAGAGQNVKVQAAGEEAAPLTDVWEAGAVQRVGETAALAAELRAEDRE